MSDPDLKAAMQRARLSYADTASLLGVGVETLRTWLNASSSRRAQPRYIKTLNWLIDHQFAMPVGQGSCVSLLARLHALGAEPTLCEDEGQDSQLGLAIPRSERARSDLSEFLGLLRLAKVSLTINEAMAIAAQLLDVCSFLTLAQMLKMVPVPAERVAYEFEADGLVVALLSGYGNRIEFRFVREAKLPAHIRIDPVPVKFEFHPQLLQSVVDNESAQHAIEQCVIPSIPWALDVANGDIADIAHQARDSLESLMRPIVFRVLIAHALVRLAGVAPDQTI